MLLPFFKQNAEFQLRHPKAEFWDSKNSELYRNKNKKESKPLVKKHGDELFLSAIVQ